MNKYYNYNDDIKFALIIFFALGLFLTGIAWASYKPQGSVINSTSCYIMPEELKDYKVYVLVGKGHSRNLYVICKDKKPIATTWDENAGKTNTRFDVLTPELND